jgi:hypothetical protein
MPVGAALSEQSSGESISHFGTIRIEVDGNGQLRLAVYSLHDIRSKLMVPFTMTLKSRYSRTRIVNFMEQRASFEIKTTQLGEKFRINRLVIFTKPVYKSLPGN